VLELLLEGSLELLLDEDELLAVGLELLEIGSGDVGLLVHPKRGARPAMAAPPERRMRNSRRSPSLSSRLRCFFGWTVLSCSLAMVPPSFRAYLPLYGLPADRP
jgi:hypothetical protein